VAGLSLCGNKPEWGFALGLNFANLMLPFRSKFKARQKAGLFFSVKNKRVFVSTTSSDGGGGDWVALASSDFG
jgi:hypothetical protein